MPIDPAHGGSSHGPADTSVYVPESVRRASAAADQIHQQAYQTAVTGATGATGVTGTSDVTAAVTGATGVTGAAPPAAATGTTGPAGDEHDLEYWRHRATSAEGRYKQTNDTLRLTQDQLAMVGDELQRSVSALQGARPPGSIVVGAPQPAAQTQSLITPEETQAYTPELIDLTKRAAREALAPELQALQVRNQQLEQRLNKVNTQTMAQALHEAVPDYQQINVDPEFIRWLSLPDLYSGQVRGKLLNAAFAAGQAPRVAAFFKGYLAERGTATQETGQTQQQTEPAPPARQAAVDLSTIASPGRARAASGEQNLPADKPIYTRAQVTEFYRKVARGEFAGNEQEKTRLERDLFAAQNEGRIR